MTLEGAECLPDESGATYPCWKELVMSLSGVSLTDLSSLVSLPLLSSLWLPYQHFQLLWPLPKAPAPSWRLFKFRLATIPGFVLKTWWSFLAIAEVYIVMLHNQACIKSKHTERKQIHLTNSNHLSEHNFWALLEKALLYFDQRKEKGRGGRRESSLLHNYSHTLFISEVGVNMFHNDEHTKTTIFSIIDLSQTDFCFW